MILAGNDTSLNVNNAAALSPYSALSKVAIVGFRMIEMAINLTLTDRL
jgi:hypothetical protein